MQFIGNKVGISLEYGTNECAIIFYTKDKNVLNQFEELKDVDKINVEAKKWRKKRSLDANSYCWVLCDKIAKKIGATKEEIYKDAISNVGTFEPMIVEEKAFENFKRIWEKQGLGFLIQEVNRKDKCIKVHCYYGSSSYDSKEMSVLIDFIVQEAKQVGVEIMPENELKSLLEAWS